MCNRIPLPPAGHVLAALACLALAAPAAPAAPVKRALLIGIDEYQQPDIPDLRGCGNDVELMRSILTGKFEFEPANVAVLKNDEATRQGIIDAIRSHLVEPASPGDIVLMHYSGHGSQMKDRSGDEVDGYDETIVPHDSREDGVFDISDDEINGLMKQISDKTENVAFILDSCHSGSAARAAEVGNTVRQIRPDERTPPPPADFALGARGLSEGADGFRLPGANYVLITGCRANELSNETLFESTRHGVMTYYLASALRSVGEEVTYRELMEQVRADVTARFPSQHPQIEGTGVDTVVFGERRLPPQPFVLVEPNEGEQGRATVRAGAVHGVAADSLLDVYPAGTRRFDGSVAPVARVRIARVSDFDSEALVESGAVAPHSRAVLLSIRPPYYRTRVLLGPAGSSTLIDALAAGLGEHESVEVVHAPGDDAAAALAARADAQIRVTVEDGRVVLRGRDNEKLSEIDAAGRSAAADAVQAIAGWARWFAVLAIDNPAPGLDFDLRIQRRGARAGDPPPETVHVGDLLELAIENRSRKDLYAVMLDLASDGSILVVYPPPGVNEAISPGRTVSRQVKASVPADRTVAIDHVKAIVTTEPIPSEVFRQAPLSKRAALPLEPDASPLARFLRRAMAGRTRNLEPVDVGTWATRQRVLRVVRSAVETDGYALHFGGEMDGARALSMARSGSRAVCEPWSSPGCLLEVVPPEDDSGMAEVLTPSVRSGDRTVQSVGQAFDTAYDIRDETGAVRVEPLFEQELSPTQTAPHPDDPTTRGGGGRAPDPRAERDPLWSHRYVRVPEAWADLRRSRGAVDGAEAAGVFIAHPDTGYLEHPEIWLPEAERPVLPDGGYDYHADDDDPADELNRSRPLDNPAHGTGSSSAIISVPGCQLENAVKCPTGVARGARLVPLRINSSVVNFNQRKLARALLDASGTDRRRIKVDTDMASIAMGGPPSWALWRAVERAEARGFIIVAAAGNYVRKVVWPARFDSVIAVAAVNPGCKPWSHSSRGPAVDVAAPGEHVWRATVDGANVFVTGMGTGTTYGTATTSGVVALWVARHSGTPEYEALKSSGRLTQVLRRLLRETAWQPGGDRVPATVQCDQDAGWSEGKFGAGIVDAAALLSAPLPAEAAPRSVPRASVRDLPLWRSLYPGGEATATRDADYRRLFDLDPAADLETVAIYEAEVLYHYAANEGVASSIDEVVLEGNRGEAVFVHVRQSLRAQDLSNRLRSALP